MLDRPLDEDRHLPGIDLNVEGQLATLRSFTYAAELLTLEDPPGQTPGFRWDNRMFEAGDAELWYSVIRSRRPRRIIEIGSGQSTLVARKAIAANQREDPFYTCEHVCIEPYEAPWLESTGVEVLRERVEQVPLERFAALGPGDLLFVDSSHIIRPQGDVLHEYLTLLPSLRPGVLVHVHDIFTPRDYLAEWVLDNQWLWNEQYLLESLITDTNRWTVVLAANYLTHHHLAELQAACPNLRPEQEPGSFYIQRT